MSFDVIDGGAWAALPGRWTLLANSRVLVAQLCLEAFGATEAIAKRD